jgi:8-oxo-dGTP pyrophosphatase MutT (NUDIX family)
MDEEYISLFDKNGLCIGSNERTLAYASGQRVGLVFIWNIWKNSDGIDEMLLQTRSRPNDPFAGNIDAPAGGHIRAKETPLNAAIREWTEEVGTSITADQLIPLGFIPVDDFFATKPRKVTQFFFLNPHECSLMETAFSEEVQAFSKVEFKSFSDLVFNRVNSINAVIRSSENPDSLINLLIKREALSAYTPAIVDVIKRSMDSIQHYLNTSNIDPTIWNHE